MIVVAIYGLWKYFVVPIWRDVIVPLELVEEKLHPKRETDPAGLACPRWLSVLASFPGVDPAFHVLLAHPMRS